MKTKTWRKVYIVMTGENSTRLMCGIFSSRKRALLAAGRVAGRMETHYLNDCFEGKSNVRRAVRKLA